MPKRGYLRPLKPPKKGKLRPPKNSKKAFPSFTVNGPLLQHADPVIKAALRSMFKNSNDKRDMEGMFIRRNNNV